MHGIGRWIAACAMALSISGCTLLGLGLGAGVASSRNSDPAVQQGLEPRTSVGKSMALGAGFGLLVDIAFIAFSVSSGQFGH